MNGILNQESHPSLSWSFAEKYSIRKQERYTNRMKLILHSFRTQVPLEKTCEAGVDYDVMTVNEVQRDEVLPFLDKLILPRDIFYLEDTDYSLDCWKHEGSIWVEIYVNDYFWATSEVSVDELKAIIDSLHRKDQMGKQIPTTQREWDACAL